MQDLIEFLKQEGVSKSLLDGVQAFKAQYPVVQELKNRVPQPKYYYYGNDVWEKALAVLLTGRNLLLAGPKATGKNVLSENLAALFGRPVWNVSFHINADAAYLIGTDTFDGQKVVFRPGPIMETAVYGGFAILDEINMAKNEALAVMHSALDYRRMIDVSGYDRVEIAPAARFIATMNYGYAGTRDLNEALCSRFAIIDMPNITEDDLVKLITTHYPKLKRKMAEQFSKLFTEIEKKAENSEISDRALDLRGMLDAIGLIETGLTSGDALKLCIVNQTFDAYERGLIQDVIAARIPQDLKTGDVFEA